MENVRNSKRKDLSRKKKMLAQKGIGLLLLVISVAVVLMAMSGITPEDRDITPALIFAPLGFWILFSRECWFD